MSTIRIAIADDHQMFVDGLKSIIEQMPEMQLVIEANNGKQLLGQLAQTQVDVVLMDMNMPEMDGLEATKKIVVDHPSVKVLMITMHDTHDYIQKLLKAGAHGYILKNTGKQELATAIKTVYAGQSYYSQQVTQRIMDHLSGQKQIQNDLYQVELTERETDVLKLIAAELTTGEIADKLCISAHTVESHRKNLLAKLQVKNSLGLVKYAMKMGLVE